MSFWRKWRINRILAKIRYQDCLHVIARADQVEAESIKAEYAANRAFERANAARDRQKRLRQELAHIGTKFF